ncbi:MAG TPA: UpxY family transcription antiterminator [Vicinamibacterales bacterium]|nr:UpxY family transcription antiterminator [Vicinamibacterales bacterium]
MTRAERVEESAQGLSGPWSTPAPALAEPTWFAVWTRSRHEASVAGQLAGKSIESFLPTLPRWSRWKDRRKRIDWPLFPGYCFARFDLSQSLAVRSCAGVVSLVSTAGRPVAIGDEEIESIRTLVTSDLRYDPCPLIHVGDRVEVVSGPLRGVVGRLERKGAHARLVLSVDLIGQGVSVEIDAADVRPY